MDRFLPADLREDLTLLFQFSMVLLGIILLALTASLAHAGVTQQAFVVPDTIIFALVYLACMAGALVAIAFLVHIDDVIAHITRRPHPYR